MNRPLYKNAAPSLANEGHRGLWFERFFNQYGEDWRVLEEQKEDKVKGKSAQGKAHWIKQVQGSCGNLDELARHARKLHQLAVVHLQGQAQGFETDWHFATGLGNPHPVENGFLWHPTLGVPYLPGAALKGLLRAWVEHWDDSLEPAVRQQRIADWFGVDADTAKKDKLPEQAGGLIFFDALPIEPVVLALDVMTPHYGKWYEQGGNLQNPNQEPEKVPAHWHNPIPVPFLVFKDALFFVAIAPRRPEHQAQVQPALKALELALAWLGAGAKTAVGYGRMVQNDDILNTVQESIKQENQRREEEKQAQEKRRRKSALSPLEQAMEDIIDQRQDKNLAPYIALIQAVESGRWQGEDRCQVAAKIKALMQQTKGQWKEQSSKPDKDKDYKRTQMVKAWLT